MRPAALIAVAGLFCGTPAFATLDTGKTLWDTCNDPDTSKQSYCLGYVAGVSDVLVGMHIICIGHVSVRQIADVVPPRGVGYAQNHH
jgi:hypothetical protein